MPELPEVECVVRSIGPLLTGRTIRSLSILSPRQAAPDAGTVEAGVVGRKVVRVWRRGKQIVIRLAGGGALLVHLKMSGRFVHGEAPERERSHVRAVFDLGPAGRLLFVDARRFGRLRLVDDPEEALAGLGPEPLGPGFTADLLATLLGSRRRAIKTVLLDQAAIAGIGNIYADESLHRAGVHPLARSDRLSLSQVGALHRSIRAALRAGIENNGTSIDWIWPEGRMQTALRVYGRPGQPCRACNTPIVRIVVGQRSTHFCPTCQPG